ncbi:MAG: MerR family DNA-binding transcriptional regulator [Okeania sp. SIO3H1]|nr:MerR family DNA-binding transcriptional regulator [Okeania sp. SIO3H1]
MADHGGVEPQASVGPLDPATSSVSRGKRDLEIYTIGELAEIFGLTLRTLRFYEDKGLITPMRRGSTRLYTRRDRGRLRLVLMGKRVGFSLEEIKEMLDLYDLKDGQLTQLRVACEKFNSQIENLKQQRDEIDQGIAELSRARDVVAGMLKEKEKSTSS